MKKLLAMLIVGGLLAMTTGCPPSSTTGKTSTEPKGKMEDKKPTTKEFKGPKMEDKKPEDKKPEDKKPEDKKPEDKKPQDKKPEDKKPEDKKPIK